MSENILKIKYYKNGQFKGSEGVSIFQSSNLQSTLQFKFDEDLGDASVVANILVPYPEGSQLYGQHQKQSLFMKKQVDAEGGYIYSSAILGGYLATNGKAYVNAQVFASDGYIDSINTGNGIVVNGIPYIIGYTTETIGGVSVDLLNLLDVNSNKVYVQNQAGIIVLQNNLICLIKEFVASVDGDGNFNGTLRLTSGVEVKNYQQVEFKVTASAPYYVDYPMTIEESYVLRQALASAQSDIAAAQADILLKQDKVDPDINEDGVDHSVVGNINDLLDRANTDEGDIGTLQGQMATAQQDIADLQRIVGYGINIVGTMTTQDALPSDQDVSDYVIAQTGEAPSRGLAVIVKVDYTSGTDEIYFYVYDGTSWHHFEMQFLNDSENGVKGLIQGNYNAADSTPGKLMVSIVGGEVAEIYYNDANSVRHSMTSVLADVVAKVINGTSAVEMAKKDGNGNNIATTYQTKAEGATKTYVQEYAEPKALFELNYPDYATGIYKENNVSDNSYNKTINSASVGYSILDVLTVQTKADILLGKQNGTRNRIWIVSTYTEGVKLRITTEYQKQDLTYEQLAVSVTDTISFVSGIPVLVTIDSVFSGLSTPITLPANTEIRQTIEVWREDGTSADYTLLCNTTYDAYMELSKIGYARYVFEEEPAAIECGHDSSPTIDSDGDLQVASDGQIHYANGSSASLTTILKVPMDNGLADPSSVLPARAGQVASALAEKVEILDVTGWTIPLSQERFDLLNVEPKPILKRTSSNTTRYYVFRIEDQNLIEFSSPVSGTGERYYFRVNKSSLGLALGSDYIGNLALLATQYYQIPYNVGDIVTSNGLIFQCNTPITTPELWNSAHWTQIKIADAIMEKQDKLADGLVPFLQSEYNKTLNLCTSGFEAGGYWSNGSNNDGYSGQRTKDFIAVQASTQYCLNYAHQYVLYYDSSKALLSYDDNDTLNFTTPASCAYIKFSITDPSVTDIMLVEGSTAHAYVPYNGAIVHEKEFQDRTQKSLYNLGAFDSVTDNGNGTVTITRKTGYVDLGDLSWAYLSANSVWYVPASDLNGYSNAVPSKASNYKTYTDKSYTALASGELTTFYSDFSANPNIIVNTGSSTTKPSGLLEYELATATTENLIKDEQVKFQTPITAEEVKFNQLVPNDKQQAIMASNTSTVIFNYSSNAGDKLFVKMAYTLNGGDFVLNCKYNDDSTETIITGASQANSYATIFTATKPIVNFYYYSNTANQEYSDFNIINLTEIFDAGQEPDLTTCQALFNTTYPYTSGTDMQLIKDTNPIALVELPLQPKMYNHDITIFNNTNPQTIMMSINLITKDSGTYNLSGAISAIRSFGSGTQRIQCAGSILYNGEVFICTYMAVTSSQAGFVAQKATTGETYTFYSGTDITVYANDVVRPL